jgi:general stress protein 26
MNLIEYFKNKDGFGIPATADAGGHVDGAPYSKPHFEDGHTVTFIMADRLSHKNLESNPHAAFIFREEGGFEGKRLFLTKIREENDAGMIDELMKKRHPAWYEAYKDRKKFLVYFRIEKVLPLVIKESDRDSLYVRVKDGTGTDYLCPIDVLVDPNDATEEELDNCVDSAVVERYAGNVKVVD